jgi:lipid II:glycine glycyltransferase (peptidoglycan interpeptide bridge formation enzyme)
MEWKLWKGSDQEWDAVVSALPYAQFAQSSAWSLFQKSLGRKVIRLGTDDGKAAVQFVHVKKMIGSFWLAKRGPIFASDIDARNALAALAKQAPALLDEGAWFLRIEPVPAASSHAVTMPEMLLRRPSHDPSITRLLDVTASEEEILAQLHHKTRYNIRVAQKHELMIREVDSVDQFLLLQRDTAKRDRFAAQSDDYVRKQFDLLKKNGTATLLVAEKGGIPLAANFLIAYGDTVTYLYGASSSSDRQLMAPYLLHWDSILWAKHNGFRYYDFWGVNPAEKTHPDFKKAWDGISRFKAGWGGAVIELPGTYDIPVKSLYYKLGRSIRKI